MQKALHCVHAHKNAKRHPYQKVKAQRHLFITIKLPPQELPHSHPSCTRFIKFFGRRPRPVANAPMTVPTVLSMRLCLRLRLIHTQWSRSAGVQIFHSAQCFHAHHLNEALPVLKYSKGSKGSAPPGSLFPRPKGFTYVFSH